MSELSAISEETYDINDKGEAITQRLKLSIIRNIKFAFNIYAKAHNTTFKLDVSDSGWNAFREGLKVRDRLMHPKRGADFHISDDEIHITYVAGSWFIKNTNDCFDAIKLGNTIHSTD